MYVYARLYEYLYAWLSVLTAVISLSEEDFLSRSQRTLIVANSIMDEVKKYPLEKK
jgi:hypothetical protein